MCYSLKKNPEERPPANELLDHVWVKKYTSDCPTHFCRWIHQTLRMLNKRFVCTSESCGECYGSYIESASPGKTPTSFFYETI